MAQTQPANTNSLTMASPPQTKLVMKPFQIEKESINTIQNQQMELQIIVKYLQDIIPKNVRWYSEYGEKIMQNAEKLRMQIVGQAPLSQDFYHIIMWLSQYFEIIGKLFSQNYADISEEIGEQMAEPILKLRELKDSNIIAESLKFLPKAISSFQQVDKLKTEYEKAAKEAQDSMQKMKSVKADPELIYNISLHQEVEEKAQKAIKYMEEKKTAYEQQQENLNQRNEDLIESLNKVSEQHIQLISVSISSIQKVMETSTQVELSHYDSLSILPPEKAKALKNFQIKPELILELKNQDEKLKKPNLVEVKQKISELTEGSFSYTTLAPHYQSLYDTQDIYQQMCDKFSKLATALQTFFSDQYNIEKTMFKFFREISLSDKKRKEMTSGALQSVMSEQFKLLDQKEKNHLNYMRYLESLLIKLEQNMKAFKTDERNFTSVMSKILKDANSLNEKTTKNIQLIEKQKEKISQQMSSNFSSNSEEKQNSQFQTLMQDYQQQGEMLKETNNNFKNILIYSIDQIQELAKCFKEQYQGHLKAFLSVIQGLTSYEETFIYQMSTLSKSHIIVVKRIDESEILSRYKSQISGSMDDILEEDEQSDGQEVTSENKEDYFDLGNGDQTASPKKRKNSADNAQFESNEKNPFGMALAGDTPVKNSPADSDMVKDRAMSATPNHESIDNIKFGRLSGQFRTNTQSFIGPLHRHHHSKKAQFDSLKVDDAQLLDEQTKKEIQQLKEQMRSNGHPHGFDDKQLSPHSKKIFKKFNDFDDDEKFLESYACALSQKILLQGRMYVTTKKIYFYSPFNEKTIFFGKDTKMMIPISNLKSIEKKMNALVFDNSISIFTKEDKEIFFTSFMYRDHAYDCIQRQIDILNGILDPSQAAIKQEPGTPGDFALRAQLAKAEESKTEESFVQNNTEGADQQSQNNTMDLQNDKPDEEIQGIQEEIKEDNNNNSNQTYDNATIDVTDKFKEVEEQRLSKVKSQIKDFDKFPWLMIDTTLDCSLKYLAKLFLSLDLKWQELGGRTLTQYLEEETVHNTNLQFTPKDGPQLIKYFSDMGEPVPSPDEFEKWPLQAESLKIKKVHVPPNPKMMQPKQNDSEEILDTYYISPRKIIRRGLIQSWGFPYADQFNLENILTLEQSESEPFKTQFKLEFRINIIKPIRFIQGIVVKESESQLRQSVSGKFKDQLIEKVTTLKEPMKQRFLEQPPPQQQQQQQQSLPKPKLIKKVIVKPKEEEKQQISEIPQQQYQQEQSQLKSQVASEQQVQQQQVISAAAAVGSNEEMKLLIAKVDRLTKLVCGVVVINMLLLIAFMFK